MPEQTIEELLSRVTRRAEDLSAHEQIQSYVQARGLSGALLNKDNKVLFGRRGTGKTHALTFIADSVEKRNDIAIYLDMRRLGSNNSIYSDASKPIAHRATYALRDFIAALHELLLDKLTSASFKLRNPRTLQSKLDAISACYREVMVIETVLIREKSEGSQSSTEEGSAETAIDLTGAKLGINARRETVIATAKGAEAEHKGTLAYSVNYGNLSNAISDLSSLGDFRIWLLLDEWSSLPSEIQPFFADFLRRALFTCPIVSVQIAAIEYRSRFREMISGTSIGFELGSDIFADVNLDDYFVFDSDQKGVTNFFAELFFRHLSSVSKDGEMSFKTAKELISGAFTQREAFKELVRACEGVPRDFINIAKLAFARSNAAKVSMPEVRAAAKAWYERDKEASIDTREDARLLLQRIRDEIVVGKKLRSFLVEWSTRSDALEYLFDERIIHIARRSYSAKDNPGKRYRVWNLDFGCYVDSINTAREPDDISGTLENTSYENVNLEVPEDDYRAVRRAILEIEF